MLVINWFYTVRANKRLITFKTGLLNRFKTIQLITKSSKFKFSKGRFYIKKYLFYGAHYFLSRNVGFSNFTNYLNIKFDKSMCGELRDLFSVFSLNIKFFYKLVTILSLKRFWRGSQKEQFL